MNLALVKIIVFLKRFSIIYRFIAIPLAFFVIFSVAIPDIQFNMASGKPVEMTLEQLFKTEKSDLPRYLKVKDAVVPSGTYIEQRKEKSNALDGIYYPVYPRNGVVTNFSTSKLDSIKNVSDKDSASFVIGTDTSGRLQIVKNTDDIEAKLVIHDTHVKDSDLDSTGHYFDSPTFSIEGQYDGSTVPDDIKNLLLEEGIKLSPDAIVLNRGDKVMETSSAILLALGALIVGLLSILTFIPGNTLARWFGVGNNLQQVSSADASQGNTPA